MIVGLCGQKPCKSKSATSRPAGHHENDRTKVMVMWGWHRTKNELWDTVTLALLADRSPKREQCRMGTSIVLGDSLGSTRQMLGPKCEQIVVHTAI